MHKLVTETARILKEMDEDGYMYDYHLQLGEIFENMFDEYEDFEWDKFSNACGYLTRAEISYSTELYCGTECYGPCCATW